MVLFIQGDHRTQQVLVVLDLAQSGLVSTFCAVERELGLRRLEIPPVYVLLLGFGDKSR